MGEKKRTSTYDPTKVTDEVVLRVSKSSYNNYAMCPRQYWWNKIALPDMDIPSSEAAIRGTAIHQVMEDSLRELSLDKSCDIAADVMMDTTFNKHAVAQGVHTEAGVDALREILEAVAAEWGHLEIVELEDKHVHPHTITVLTDDGEIHYPVELVGMIDGVFRHPDGHLIVVELKTGNANQSKLSRTRGELCFYRKLLMLKGYDEPTHFLTIFPDADDADFLMQMMGKRNTEVFMGESQGLAVYEVINKRSITAMEKKLSASVHGIMTQEWPIKWNEYFCTQWCEFHLSCNEELLGIGDDNVL
jgi:CRISPR/Cas system-associated exonuclease Cas4 (RecB family)